MLVAHLRCDLEGLGGPGRPAPSGRDAWRYAWPQAQEAPPEAAPRLRTAACWPSASQICQGRGQLHPGLKAGRGASGVPLGNARVARRSAWPLGQETSERPQHRGRPPAQRPRRRQAPRPRVRAQGRSTAIDPRKHVWAYRRRAVLMAHVRREMKSQRWSLRPTPRVRRLASSGSLPSRSPLAGRELEKRGRCRSRAAAARLRRGRSGQPSG